MSEPKPIHLKTETESEREFLDRQCDEARVAIAAALRQARSDLSKGMNPAGWTREYPVVAIGSALVAGFVAATAIPSKQQRELNELKKVAQALHGPPGQAAPTSELPRTPLWHTLVREALQMIMPVLLDALGSLQDGDSKSAHNGQNDGSDKPESESNSNAL